MVQWIGGHWPELQFVVEVFTAHGYEEVVSSLPNVLFAGLWIQETGEVTVSPLWSDEEFVRHLRDVQDWTDAAVISTLDEQIQTISERLNACVKDDPWNWLSSDTTS